MSYQFFKAVYYTLIDGFLIGYITFSKASDNLKISLFRDFLNGKSDIYMDNTSAALKVRDYLAGMTDRYFVSALQRLIVPEISLGNI